MTTNGPKEASEMLAAALQQMDGILAGSRREYQNGLTSNGSPNGPKLHQVKANKLVDDLKIALENMDDTSRFFRQLTPDKQMFLKQWLLDSAETQTNGMTFEGLEEKIRRLDNDKETLLLQVSVTNDQVEAQSEKIRDMEYALRDRYSKMEAVEDMLQHELISRSSLETHKLDLMAEVSNLKLRLATSEKERKELEDSLLPAQQKIDELQSRLNDRTIEVNELKLRLAKNGTIPSSLGHMNTEQTVDRLKKAVESLMVTKKKKVPTATLR